MYRAYLYLLLITLLVGTSMGILKECKECKPLKGGQAFQDCITYDKAIIKRQGSFVTVDLTVDIASITFEWLTIKRRVYNGKMCGPTLFLKKGDTVKLVLTNLLGPHQYMGENNEQRMPNTTNIHTHGLHISSLRPGDNVFTRVDPGEAYTYTHHVDPEQPSGTYWYHAHWHGSTWFHVNSGLSGLIVVEDDTMPPELAAASCPDNCELDTHILVQSTLHYAAGFFGFTSIQDMIQDAPQFRLPKEVENYLTDPKNGFDHMTVNGLYLPTLNMKKNELRRFRIANAGGHVSLELEIVDMKTQKQSCVIKEIAYDGTYLNAPRNQNRGQSFLAIGARVDWLVYCSQPGVYVLRSRPLKSNVYSIGASRRFTGNLMTIVVEKSMLPEPKFPKDLPNRPDYVDDLMDTSVSPENMFTVEFSDNIYFNREKFISEYHYRYQMKVGTVQEWTFINTMTEAAHPLHIHVNQFQIISYNEYTGPISVNSECDSFTGQYVLRSQDGNVCNDTYGAKTLEYEGKKPLEFDQKYLKHKERWDALQKNPETAVGALGYAMKGDWRDTLQLPPLVNITVRFNVDKYDGGVVAHCHVLLHEDSGMLVTFEAKKHGPIDNSHNRKLGCDEIIRSTIPDCPASP